MLGEPDYRGILGLLEATGRAVTVAGFVDSLVEGLQRQLGYRACIFFLAEPTAAGLAPTWGKMHGSRYGLEQYGARWRGAWPIEHPAARRRLARSGVADLADYHGSLGRPQREFCERFLVAQGVRHELSSELDTGLPSHGFLTLQGDDRTAFDQRDRARLLMLRPHLANQLRALLLRGAPQPAATGAARDLSGRQLEVADLAARGLSNGEIAGVLSVTLPTVKKHLVAVYRSLGVSSRAQLAARWPELSGAGVGPGLGGTGRAEES